VLAVLQPNEHASGVRAVQRAVGTLVGTALIALLTIATGDEWLMVTGQGIAAFGLFALFARGYFWLVVLLTPTALLTLSAVDYVSLSRSSAPAGALSGSRSAWPSPSWVGGSRRTSRATVTRPHS
jgi:hypothetical protein